MRIFISLDVDQIQAAPVTLYLNQIQMKLSSKELNKLINELLWAQERIMEEKRKKALEYLDKKWVLHPQSTYKPKWYAYVV